MATGFCLLILFSWFLSIFPLFVAVPCFVVVHCIACGVYSAEQQAGVRSWFLLCIVESGIHASHESNYSTNYVFIIISILSSKEP